MKKNLFIAIRLTLFCMVLFSIGYTCIVWGIAQITPGNGKGEMIAQNKRLWYANVGQRFTEDKYFNSRPSENNYDATKSGGSNKAPSNPEYLAQVMARIDTFLVHNPTVKKSDIPIELVTESGSGLDPDISPKGALVQVKRIAAVRGISEQTLTDLVNGCIDKPLLGFIGTSKVNVLKLNMALDQLSQ